MAAPPPMQGDAQVAPTAPVDEAAAFQKIQDLLKAKDDTSRFVGLALLKAVLDNGPDLVQDPHRLQTLWEALSPKFLDRLLKAHLNQKIKREEAKDMVDLAVAVLHTFTVLIPEDNRQNDRLIGRTSPLVKALVQSSPETTELILQTLLTFVSQVQGASELLRTDDLTPLTEIAVQHPLVLDILGFTWINTSTIVPHTVLESIDRVIPSLIIIFRDTDAVTFIKFLGSLLPKLVPQALSSNPKWLGSLVVLLRNLLQKRPTLAGRAAYTQLAAVLLQTYPSTCPALLFKDEGSSITDNKPFSYLLINLLLIDLRSSFPSLLAKLNSSEYPAISERLIAAFDVILCFIDYLLRSLDEENALSMPVDLLLKLRKDIAETMSLTIEFLRDRWDASFAGASGLHPSARAGTSTTSEGTHLTLTWDSMKDNVNADPLVLAAIRTLAIWIREDDNDNLRKESAGIIDMFIELYKSSSEDTLDFRDAILTALEAILTTDNGVDDFLAQEGWQAIFQDLQTIVRISAGQTTNSISELRRGIEIIRILLAVLDHWSTTVPQEDWMAAVEVTASMRSPGASESQPLLLEFQIAMLQLSMALMIKAHLGMQKRYTSSIGAISGIHKQLEINVKGMEDAATATEFMTSLDEVGISLENIRG